MLCASEQKIIREKTESFYVLAVFTFLVVLSRENFPVSHNHLRRVVEGGEVVENC